MSSLEAHSTTPHGRSITNRELGNSLSYMRYDQIIEVLMGLVQGTEKQAREDYARNNTILHRELMHTVHTMHDLISQFERVAAVCGSHLKKEIYVCPAVRFSIVRDDAEVRLPELSAHAASAPRPVPGPILMVEPEDEAAAVPGSEENARA